MSTPTLFAFQVSKPVETSSEMWQGSSHAMAGVYCTPSPQSEDPQWWGSFCAWCYAHYHGSYMDCHCYPTTGAGSRCDWY